LRWWQWIAWSAGALLALAGPLAYWTVLSQLSGSADVLDAYVQAQAEFGRSIALPWQTLADAIAAALSGTGITTDWFARAVAWQDLAYALLGAACAVWCVRLRLSIGVFACAYMLLIFVGHGPFGNAFWSAPRYVAVLPPLYLGLAVLTSRLPARLRWGAVAASAALLTLLATWYASGRWVA
jgi:hypothetical protein